MRRQVTVDRYETCDTCHGNGCAAGTSPEVCPDCHGTGHGPGPAADAHGRVRHHLPLPQVRRQGAGSSTSPARTAGAVAWCASTRPFRPAFPPASTTARPSPSVDRATPARTAARRAICSITITVRPHELFRREGTSVLCEAPITFTQAVLGAELEIPTIDGKVKYDPAGGHPVRHHLPPEGQGHSLPSTAGAGATSMSPSTLKPPKI